MARLARLTIKLALRNLARHRGRSAIMLVALGLFVGLCVAMEAIASGFYGSMTDVAVGQTLGEVQVHAPGHLPSRDPRAKLEHAGELVERFSATQDVRVVVPRVRTVAMVSRSGDARGVDLIGADASEREFGNIPERVVEGRFLANTDHDAIVVGRALAKTLKLELGSRVSLGVGEAAARSFTVVGVFESGNRQTDTRLVYVPIAALRSALELDDDAATEIAIRAQRGSDAKAIAERLRESCSPSTCEVLVWSELQPALAASMTTDHNFLRATFAVLVLVSGIMVLNLQLMSVYERTRELGMMLALGATPRRLFGMLVVEALALGVLGVAGGLVLGLAVVAALSGGIDVIALTGGESELGGFAFAPRVYPRLGVGVALGMCFGALFVTVCAAVIPALRLFKMNPLTALRSTGEN